MCKSSLTLIYVYDGSGSRDVCLMVSIYGVYMSQGIPLGLTSILGPKLPRNDIKAPRW